MKTNSPKPGLKVSMVKVLRSGGKKKIADTIPSEVLLEMVLNKVKVSTISCSPQDITLLAVGYLVNHGYVKDFSSINFARECDRIKKKALSLRVEVDADRGKESLPKPNRAGFVSSACGSIDDFILQKKLGKIKQGPEVAASTLLGLNLKALGSQKLKKQFGGLHSAALFDSSGQLLFACEDIGRHNCIDKVAGHMYINHLSPEDKIIFTTGRLSLDAIYKIARMGVPVAVTNSSVTYSAVKLAEKINLTAVGYARGARFNIYSGQERIGE